MEPSVATEINLFGEQLSSIEELTQLSLLVNSGESRRLKFAEQLEANMTRTGQEAALAVGIGLFIVGRAGEAVEKLQKAKDCKEKCIYLAYALRARGRFDEAIASLEKSLGFGADTLQVNLEKASTYRRAGKLEAAAKEISVCANFEKISAEYHYQLGRLQDTQGLYEQAVENYKAALELAPDHQRSLFHLAYRCDLAGDDEAAIDYYRQIAVSSPVYVNALLNLAVLYEDQGEFDKAGVCIDKVLQCHPNHQRAVLFKKDIESSKKMYYDEEKEKRKSRKSQILETPISDFELSVRSRNCLKKMNIRTLGDLLRITETELLSFKNFGETSLREIKTILEPRGLHLGQVFEDKQPSPTESIERRATEDQGVLNKTVDDMQFSVRCRKCLQKLNIRTVGEIIRTTEAELLGCKNFGVTSLNEIKKTLANFGLSLRSLE